MDMKVQAFNVVVINPIYSILFFMLPAALLLSAVVASHTSTFSNSIHPIAIPKYSILNIKY